MSLPDYLIIIGYLAGLIVLGVIFSTRMKDSAEMFAAGGRAPWWVAGLSGFMTIFSAGTFVVWGGIAYRLGAVSISILILAGGTSSLLIGRVLAGRWHDMGIATPAEYVRIRFGVGAVQVYTWLNVLGGTIAMGAGLYSLSKIITPLIPLSEHHFLVDAQTGNLSVMWATLIGGVIVVCYTTAGGLWAVLMTDVIQCIVLCLAIAMVAPLCLIEVGGITEFFSNAPPKFFSPAAGEYTYLFLIAWGMLNFFLYGGQWQFVQRYICVPTARDARKAAWLIGGLYLVCPFVWMLPAMVYRVMDSQADQEQAYILACQAVLPAGMIGMMVAAMFSATASMVSSQLNVFAGVITHDIYKPFVNPDASEKSLVRVGRIATGLYGIAVIGMALLVPSLGGAEKVILPLVLLFLGPIVIPCVWGVFSKRIGAGSIWITMFASALCSGILKYGPSFVAQSPLNPESENASVTTTITALIEFVAQHSTAIDAVVGLSVPVIVLIIIELSTRNTNPGWTRLADSIKSHGPRPVPPAASTLPAIIVCRSLAILGIVMSVLTIFETEQRITMAIFSSILIAIAATVHLTTRSKPVP